jgi:hypothetical protein
MIRKGQVHTIDRHDMRARGAFVAGLFEITVQNQRRPWRSMSRSRVCNGTGYRRRARRHDDHGLRLMVCRNTIDAILAVGAIARERRHTFLPPDRATGRPGRRHPHPSSSTRPRRFRPSRHPDRYATFARSACPGAMLLDQPLAGAAEFQPRAVHQQMHGLSTADTQRHDGPAAARSRASGGNQRLIARQSAPVTVQGS